MIDHFSRVESSTIDVLSTETIQQEESCMCHVSTGAAWDRPIHIDDLPEIARAYDIDRRFVSRLYRAITDSHCPQPAVLVALLELIDRVNCDDNGLYPWPVLPFSALDLDTLERVQTPSMQAFHSVFESMALAQRNMILLNETLFDQGLSLALFCDCGCAAVKGPPSVVLNSDVYSRVNLLRSETEAVGTPVVTVESFLSSDWTSRRLDMGPAEVGSYERMWAVLSELPSRPAPAERLSERSRTALGELSELFLDPASV